MCDKELERLWAENDKRLNDDNRSKKVRTERDVVNDIVTGKCVLILDGTKFGTLLGELMKMCIVAQYEKSQMELDKLGYKQLSENLAGEVKRLRERIDRLTPHGLREEWSPAFSPEELAIGLDKEKGL